MNLRQRKYFVKVIETGNMTHAADQLHLAQPALGMQIRRPPGEPLTVLDFILSQRQIAIRAMRRRKRKCAQSRLTAAFA